MYESATYDAMSSDLTEGKYDLYVFDMLPFGHGIRMITMAYILNAPPGYNEYTNAIDQFRQEVFLVVIGHIDSLSRVLED